ncbi:hypothetical protein G7046_g3290 [Stylonectria norvegica]|nr:hypothetical protein G7046_g3290 [Stylonectria norvegica]
MSVNVAIIGGGIWAREEHLPAVLACKDLTLKAVYSRSEKSAQSMTENASHSIDVYTDESGGGYDELVKRSDIEAFIISKALLAGKHVLSEKPICENTQDAVELIKWYRSEIKGPSWCIGENWRFLKSYEFGAEQLKSMGRVLTFHGKQFAFFEPSGKFSQTEWRKNPAHQGGFLLDCGVHYIAALRTLLAAQPGNEITQVSAFTNLLRDFLPPIDTANAILRTKSGISGGFLFSVGSGLEADEWTVECENGWVKVSSHIDGSDVTVFCDGKSTTHRIPNERNGVPPEIRAWGAALAAGNVLPELEPEPALADLEVMELIFKSGEKQGATLDCVRQNV